MHVFLIQATRSLNLILMYRLLPTGTIFICFGDALSISDVPPLYFSFFALLLFMYETIILINKNTKLRSLQISLVIRGFNSFSPPSFFILDSPLRGTPC